MLLVHWDLWGALRVALAAGAKCEYQDGKRQDASKTVPSPAKIRENCPKKGAQAALEVTT